MPGQPAECLFIIFRRNGDQVESRVVAEVSFRDYFKTYGRPDP